MPERVVKGACPHDCPDTCAMLTTVDEAARAVGDRRRPRASDHRRLPLRQGLQLPRPRLLADDRILEPLIRSGAKGAGEFRTRELGRGARRSRPQGMRAAIDEHGGESVLPYSYMGTQGALQGGSIANRFMNAIGASRARAHDLRHRRDRRRGRDPGLSPEVDPEEWPHARYLLDLGLEPDVDRAASVAEAPRGAAHRRPALRRRPLPQPHRPGRRRAPAPDARAPTRRWRWG